MSTVHEGTKDMVCPYCDRGHDNENLHPEYDTSFDMICSECGKEFSVEVTVAITYTTYPIGEK